MRSSSTLISRKNAFFLELPLKRREVLTQPCTATSHRRVNPQHSGEETTYVWLRRRFEDDIKTGHDVRLVGVLDP